MNVLICTPLYGGMATAPYTISMIELMRHKSPVKFDYSFIWNESLVTRARNTLTNSFLKSNFSHLMFIDGDIEFNPVDVVKMVQSNKDIICGIYPKKSINWNTAYTAQSRNIPINHLTAAVSDFCFEGLSENLMLGSPTPIKIKRAGTGFMLIQRGVFSKLMDKVPTYKANIASHDGKLNSNDIIHKFFDSHINEEDGFLQSEDYAFCDLARSNGIDVWAAPWVRLKHVGSHVFG